MAKDNKDQQTLDLLSGSRDAITAGAALAAKRKIHDKQCEICGKAF